MTSTSTTPQVSSVQEYRIKVPKNVSKRFHVMRFSSNLNVDFTKWTQVKMERENNMKEFKRNEEELPKFGAGSEFGREAKVEARLMKFGLLSKKYKPDDQPWILKSGGNPVKKFKGNREGGISDNTAYYVFTHAADGVIEAFPLREWYKFQPIQRYKTLTADEAEEEYNKRDKHLNYFSLMLRKRLRGEDDNELDEGEEKLKKASKKKDLKISEIDEWMNTSDEDSSSNDEDKQREDTMEKTSKKSMKKGKSSSKSKKSKRRDTNMDEAGEESDDGDDEGRELDYISDSSASEPETTNQMASVAEEKALRKLLKSDNEDSNSSDSEKSYQAESERDEEAAQDEPTDCATAAVDEKGSNRNKKTKKSSVKRDRKDGKKEKIVDSSSEFSSDSSTDEDVKKKRFEKKAKKEELEKVTNSTSSQSANSSASTLSSLASTSSATNSKAIPETIDSNKRKLVNEVLASVASNTSTTVQQPLIKKPKLELHGFSSSSMSSDTGITEDAVRKYLMRKPMTTTELLQKFKSKKTGLSSEQLVNVMTQILKRINPVKQTLKGKMYLFIKS